MKELKSWRWSRLFNANILKEAASSRENLSLLAVVLLAAFLPVIGRGIAGTYVVMSLSMAGALFMLCFDICTAYDFFPAAVGGKKGNVYVYAAKDEKGAPFYHIEFIAPSTGSHEKWNVTDYVKSGKKQMAFSYRLLKQDSWYIVSPRFNGIKELGRRLSENVFITEVHTDVENCLLIKILISDTYEETKADYVVLNELCLPATDAAEVRVPGLSPQAGRNVLANMSGSLLIKKEGRYKLYALCAGNEVSYCEIIAPAIIFDELHERVALVSDDKEGYKEIYRKPYCLPAVLSDKIVEFSKESGTSDVFASVLKVDPVTKGLTEYIKETDAVWRIDEENGRIICRNGKNVAIG